MGSEVANLAAWRRRIVETLHSDVDGGESTQSRSVGVGLERQEVLSFQLGTETYGLEIREVAEILLPRPVTPLPRAPDFILGVVSLRGTVLPVMDLSKRLGLLTATEGRGARIVVLRDQEERVGFWVDRVSGVVRFAPGDVESTDFALALDRRFLQGIGYDRKGNLVAVLRGEALCDFRAEDRA